MVERFRPDERPGRQEANPALAGFGELSDQAVVLLERALGVSWYEEEANPVDLAVLALCRLRRAGAGARGYSLAGDAAVREALGQADPATVAWVAGRAISYMDEHGFPESLGSWPDPLASASESDE